MVFFVEVGCLAVATRLRRLSDQFMSETRAIYRAAGVEFEPRWFPVFYLLDQRSQVTVTDIAFALDVPHTYVSQLVKELLHEKLVRVKPHPDDGRSRLLVFTKKGQSMLDTLRPVWNEIHQAMMTVFRSAETDLLAAVKRIEDAHTETPLSALVHYSVNPSEFDAVTIVPYQAHLREWFERLNREWLEAHFSVEPIDEEYFANPERKILAKGGEIVFAMYRGEIVGTCALLRDDEGVFELARLAVTATARGHGIGKRLAREMIDRARARGAPRVTLITHSKLVPAGTLYKKLGFVTTFSGQHPHYARANQIMELALQPPL